MHDTTRSDVACEGSFDYTFQLHVDAMQGVAAKISMHAAQLMRPGIGQNASCAVGDFV